MTSFFPHIRLSLRNFLSDRDPRVNRDSFQMEGKEEVVKELNISKIIGKIMGSFNKIKRRLMLSSPEELEKPLCRARSRALGVI